MSGYTLVWPESFTRNAGKFLARHPDLHPKVTTVLRDLESDPFQPHLKFHHPTGKLKGVQAVSITHGYRITLTVMVVEREIILLDIGSRDEVFR